MKFIELRIDGMVWVMKGLNKLAREIVENNQYMTLGTTDPGGSSWVAPVVYARDKNWNLYFISIPDSRHCSNIKLNDKVSAAIFDSHQKVGEGVGIQMEGVAEETSLKDTPLVTKMYFSRKYPYGRNMKSAFSSALKSFLDGKVYRFYKLTPTRVWINDPNADRDVRVEVALS